MSENRNDRAYNAAETPEEAYISPAQDDSAYSDAYYTAARHGQRSYGYNPSRCSDSQTYCGQPRRRQHRFPLGAVICICLMCMLLTGAIAIGAAYFFLRNSQDDAQQTAEETEDALDVYAQSVQAASQEDMPLSTQSVEEGAQALTPEEIYPLACEQVVGMSTSVNQYNIFGQTSSTSVSGTGVILSEDGYILTNYHVIENAYESGYDITVILYGGDSYVSEVVGVESDSDLAVLKIDAEGLVAATLGNSDDLVVGQTIYAVGNPLGELTYTMTSGIVSALDRMITTDENITVNMFQIDAAVNNGNSGGPVYNAYGQVVGIVTAKFSDGGMEGLGFAIPISDAVSIANELITNGYVSGKAYLGLTLTTVSPSVAVYYNMLQGVYVYAVEEGSCSEEAGLQAGDIIVAIDGTQVLDKSALLDQVKQYRAGDSAELTVFRNQEYITITVIFDEELPAQQADSLPPISNGSSTDT